MTLPDFIQSTYNSLLDNGWKMNDIDNMDMLGFYKVRAWKAKREYEKKRPKHRYIDDVWGHMKPNVKPKPPARHVSPVTGKAYG